MMTEKKTNLLSSFFIILYKSYIELKKKDPLTQAGATAFFTSFALPPILIILFQVFSLFLSRKLVGSEMMEMLTSTLGQQGAEQIRLTTRGFRTLAQTWYTATLGFLFLAFVATTLFQVIKNSIHNIWDIRTREKSSLIFNLRVRARSLGVIFVAGILFLSGIVLDTFEVLTGKYIGKIWPGGGAFFSSAANEIIGIVIITCWFIILFRYLADARPTWRVAIVGGVFTGILFSLGKIGLSSAISHSNVGIIYGATGSLVLLLLFVFYSAFILYFGASFVKVYAESINHPIQPVHKAFKYEMKRVE